MLVSVLLDQAGQLIAGGLTCDQLPLGNRYWRDVLGVMGTSGRPLEAQCETAVVEVNDRDLVTQILSYHLDPQPASLSSIMARLEQPLRTKHRVVVAKFAA